MGAVLEVLMKGGPGGVSAILAFAVAVLWKELKSERDGRLADMRAQAKLFQRMAKLLPSGQDDNEGGGP